MFLKQKEGIKFKCKIVDILSLPCVWNSTLDNGSNIDALF